MQHRIENETAKYQFDSLPELQRWIEDTDPTWSLRSSHATGRGVSWDLGAEYSGAIKLAATGWVEGAKRVASVLATLPPKDTRPNTLTDVYGHLPHVARYCAGAPDSMIRYARDGKGGSGKIITLYVNVCANAGTKAANMANLGIGIASAINDLEQQGKRVELYGTFVCRRFSGEVTALSHSWRIKRADQPLDLAVLAFSIGHPAMFRRLGFALYERSVARQTPGYGVSGPAKLADLIDPSAGAYIINGMVDANSIADTAAKARSYVRGQIANMLIEVDAS